ncbi:RND family efflux transporter, MFP subunit [Puniceibacterium sediminis]|uniref:RND family efflux transporter, MFP subunit n=2 Tax=Puniceibacterium sediminis TaxID=1608407 RepID=A0A238Z8Y7_9RHOB|nr:RND family efflux transporter, MFP subunit [Puniceibacterium sediminis]
MLCHLAVNRIKRTRIFSSVVCVLLGAALPAVAGVKFDCVVQPNRIIAIGSPVTGILSEVIVARGDPVAKGQVLARLEAELETATVAVNSRRAGDETSIEAQRVRLKLAQHRMTRAEKLLERGATTREAFDEAAAELEVGRAELERLKVQKDLAVMELGRAKATLARRTIKSPISGVVAARRLSPGEFVTQEAWIVQLADLDPLYVEVFLPTEYFDQLALGQIGEVALRQPPDTHLPAEVVVVDSVFDATSNTFGVRLELPNPDVVLPAGQRCKVTLNINEVEPGSGGFNFE